MSDPYVREVGRVENDNGESLHVGVDDGAVAIYANGWLSADGMTLTPSQAEDFAQLFVSACWQAGQNARQMAEEIHEADGGDSMAACDAQQPYQHGVWECTETGPHRVHLARDAISGRIMHAWEDPAEPDTNGPNWGVP